MIRFAHYSLCCLLLPLCNAIAQNATLLKDILPGESGSNPSRMNVLNGKTIFSARNSEFNYALWSTDGTEAGTVMLAEINVDTLLGSTIGPMVYFNQCLYFAANDGIHGSELWKTDGTPEGTKLVADIQTGAYSSFPGDLTVFKNQLFFRAYSDEFGFELWKTGGESGNTQLVADMAEGTLSFFPLYFYATDDYLYFTRSNNEGVYCTDGTADGTVALSLDVLVGVLDDAYFCVYRDMIYFRGKDPIGPDFKGVQLWRINGFDVERVTEWVSPQTDFNPAYLTATDEYLYFVAEKYPFGRELWACNESGAFMVTDINPVGDAEIAPILTAYQNRLFFSAYSVAHGIEPWVSDGSPSGTQILLDICPGSAGSYPVSPKLTNDMLFFTADNGMGDQIWKWSEINSTPQLFSNLNDGAANSAEMVYMNGYYIFTGSNDECGLEPWIIEMPSLVQEFNPYNFDDVRLWPNPADEYVQVDFNSKVGKSYEFSMVDLQGNVVFRCKFKDQRVFPVNTLDIEPGEYIIQIQNREYVKAGRILIK
jgi:ELWxxDGT repeat protein